MINPLAISVVMGVYSESDNWVNAAVESILNQTFSDFEFIIINDNPEDPRIKNLLDYWTEKDARIKIIENTKNIGLTKSLNLGLKVARGKYIARMDADDISLPFRLKVQYDFMENHKEYLICGANAFVLIEEKKTDKIISKPVDHKDIISNIYYQSPMIHPTFFFRNIEGLVYDSNFKYAQDYAFLVSLLTKGRFYNCPEPLIYYRRSSSQITNNKLKEQNTFAKEIRYKAIKIYFDNNKLAGSNSQISIEERYKLIKKQLLDKNLIDRPTASNIFLSLTLYFQPKSLKSALTILMFQPFLRLSYRIRIRLILSIFITYKEQAVIK